MVVFALPSPGDVFYAWRAGKYETSEGEREEAGGLTLCDKEGLLWSRERLFSRRHLRWPNWSTGRGLGTHHVRPLSPILHCLPIIKILCHFLSFQLTRFLILDRISIVGSDISSLDLHISVKISEIEVIINISTKHKCYHHVSHMAVTKQKK